MTDAPDSVQSPTVNEVERMKDELALMIYNFSLQRQMDSSRVGLDDRRNLNHECGYPDTTEITPKDYKDQYERNGIAARTVEVFPKECWKIHPSIIEDEDIEVTTDFEKAFSQLHKGLTEDEENFYEQEKGNPIWEYLVRTDILCGVGSYGGLLIGVSDGEDLDAPVFQDSDNELLYLRSFDESLMKVLEWEKDENNRRFGRPVKYGVTLNDPKSSVNMGSGFNTKEVPVHWTRMIHVGDNLGSSEVFGTSRMQPVINRLLDCDKLYGGSAEMYYKGAFPGYLFSSDPALKTDVNWNVDTIRRQIENYFNGLQRYAAVKGMHADSLAPQVVDPTPQIMVQIEAICIRLGIPKRIFMGSERGNLASTQDEKQWNDRLMHRQSTFITPRIIVPFVNRLIWMGILPKPKRFGVVWPELETLTVDERADVAVKRSRAMAEYVAGDVEAVMPLIDFYVKVLGFTKKESDPIVRRAKQDIVDRFTQPPEPKVPTARPPQSITTPTGQIPTGKNVATVGNIHKELLGRLKAVDFPIEPVQHHEKELDTVDNQEKESEEELEEVSIDVTRIQKVDSTIINESEVQGPI